MKPNLTSGEISSLWTNYLNDSMAKQMLKFMLQHINDPDIKEMLEKALHSSTQHLEFLQNLFKEENFAIPNGFSEEDVNWDAPWLFTDIFCITFLTHFTNTGLVAYSGFLRMSTREDIRAYFSSRISETVSLFNQATDVTEVKGINAKYPMIEVPKNTEVIQSKDYLSGLNPFDEKRPLNSTEISHLYMNILTNSLGTNLCMAFAQTSDNKEVKDYILRLKEISQKHKKVFMNTLEKNHMETPRLPDVAISESTTQTFSDRLIMFHLTMLSSTGFGNYAASAAASMRLDLAMNYERLSLETAKIMKSGIDIMIKHKWFEQPPGSADRNQLTGE